MSATHAAIVGAVDRSITVDALARADGACCIFRVSRRYTHISRRVRLGTIYNGAQSNGMRGGDVYDELRDRGVCVCVSRGALHDRINHGLERREQRHARWVDDAL